MSETVDKLIYAIGANNSEFKAAAADTESVAQKSGKKVADSFSKPMQDAAAKTAQSAAAVQKALGGTTDAAAKQAKEIENLRAKYDGAYAAQQKAAAIQADLNKLVGAGVITQQAAAKTLQQLTAATTSGHGSTAVATREFRALFDELSSGRTRMTPGTLAIIATRVFGISGATLAWGAALAAIPAALLVATGMAESEFANIQRQIESTGYAAGVTRDKVVSMAQALNQASSLSFRGAESTLGTLASRGNVDQKLLPDAAKAAAGLSVAAKIPLDKAAEELEKMLADPAKGAQELYSNFKLLNSAQMEEIKDLQARGELTKAQAVLIEAVNDRFGQLRESAWSLAKGWDVVAKGFSNFWNNTGSLFSGHNLPVAQQVTIMRGQQADIQADLKAHGVPSIDTARKDITAGLGGMEGHAQLVNMVSQYDALQKRIDGMTHAQAIEDQKAKGGALVKAQTDAVNAGLVLEKEYGDYSERVKKLGEEQDRANKAVAAAIGPNVQFQDGLKKTAAAISGALEATKKFGDPAQEAQRRAAEQDRINRARPEDRARISGEVEAARTLRENLQNPKMNPYAQSIYKSQMANADAPDRFKKQEDERAKAIREINAQAASEEGMAAAYKDGLAAVEAARIAGEAHAKTVSMNIHNAKEAAKFEDDYAKALQRRAFAQEQANIGSVIARNDLANIGLAAQIAAGGNPAQLAKARREADVQAQTAPEFARASTMEQHMAAYADYTKLLSQANERDHDNAIITGQGEIYGARQQQANLQQTYQAVSGGANDDDMRHLAVAQKTFDDLIRLGLDPADKKFQELYNTLDPVNQSISDLTDRLQKMQAEAKELASDVTSPFKKFLLGKENPKDLLPDISANVADTLVTKQIIEPMNKQLTGMFGDLLGGPGTNADGTLSSPYYVIPMGPNGMPGIGGGGIPGMNGGGGMFGNLFGGGGSTGDWGGSVMDDGSIIPAGGTGGGGLFGGGGFFSSLFGGGGGGAGAAESIMDDGSIVSSAAGGSDILDTLLSFVGLFDSGGTVPPGKWGIKSGIPEIIQGGTAGVSVMPVSAPIVSAAIGSGTGNGAGPSNTGGGPSTVIYEGDRHEWNLPGVTDPGTFIRSRSQMEGVASKVADRGKRNR